MHEAPAVTYPVGRAPALAAMLAGLWLAGAAAWLAWCHLAGWALDWRQAVAAVVVLAAGVSAWQGWRTLPQGELDWNGREWVARLDAGQTVVAGMHVQLDLQTHLLLRLHPGRGARGGWTWAARRAAPSRWNDLRRALVARGAIETAPSAALAP